jgi:hypothetical protein
MGFQSNNLLVNGEQAKTPFKNTPPISENDLSLSELEFLINTLKDIDLKGYQVEIFYNMVIKLQNQYIEKSK